MWSVAEVAAHEALIEDALSAAATHRQIVDLLRQRHAVSKPRGKILLQRVLERRSKESEKHRASNKAMAEMRVLADIRAARADKKWSAVASLENLLAEIQGTKEAIKVNVDTRISESMTLLIAGMTGDQLEELAREYDAQEAPGYVVGGDLSAGPESASVGQLGGVLVVNGGKA